jgi:hypothetical protein
MNKQMNKHFSLTIISLEKIPAEVDEFLGRCKKSQGRCKTISGDVRPSPPLKIWPCSAVVVKAVL